MNYPEKTVMQWLITSVIALVILFFVGVFTGCGNVVTTNVNADKIKKGTVYYYLPESLIKIRSTAKVQVPYDETTKKIEGSYRIIEQSFTVTSEIIADTKNLLTLNYNPNALASDEIKYGVNVKGLLETVNVTLEDRTANIIAQLAEAPKTILTTSGEGRGTTIIKLKEFSAEFLVKASFLSNKPKKINWNIVIPNELGVDEYVTVKGGFNVTSLEEQTILDLKTAIQGSDSKSAANINGIITRPLKNLPIVIEASDALLGNGEPLYCTIIDLDKIVIIPVSRTAFAKKINRISIQDGVITSNEISKPSSLEGFVMIPISIAKAIVSIPGQLITFRYDNTKRLNELEKEKLAYDKIILDSEKFAISKSQELDNIKLELQKTEMKNSQELEKVKFELQKMILQAEKDQLTAKKELDALKEEIEKLQPKTP
jgi:hypothetical protein